MLQNLFIKDFRDMKLREKFTFISREKVKALVGFVVFIMLIFKVFCNITYLFREVGYNRNHIVGIENENVDMVYVGGSAAFVYWEPLKAWNDCGFTSYSYATNTVQAENIKAYIKEVQKTQNPGLYVVGLRAFQYYSDQPAPVGLRNGTDSMDLTSCARYELLLDYFSNRTVPGDEDILSYYIDIIKYHTNTQNLGSIGAWSFIDNNGVAPSKGWEWISSYAYLEEAQGFETDERAELLENGEKILIDLLDYCKEEELNVLFVVCPYYLTVNDQKKYNTIGDIIESYGFNYLNTNEYYDEMGIDFTTDFYNKNHVNLFGAEKYTKFLEDYIMDNYNMPDHRGDNNYSSWDQDYQRFKDQEAVNSTTVTNLRLDVEKGLQIADAMRATHNFSEWYILAKDERFSMLVTVGDNVCWPKNISEQKIMESLGLKDGSQRQIRVVNSSIVIYSNEADMVSCADGTLGPWGDISYHISEEEGISSILVDGEEMTLNETDVNIVVFDNNYRIVVDSVTLRCEDDGKIHIYREKFY